MSRNIRIKITNAPQFSKAVGKRLNNTLVPSINKEVRDAMIPRMQDVIREYWQQSEFRDAILGGQALRTRDLQAVFGLTDDLAEDAVYQIEDVLASTIRVTRDLQSGLRYGLKITLQSDDKIRTKLLDLEVASYASYNNQGEETGFIINWLQWAIDKESPVMAAYIDFDTSTIEDGRSGRAIMVKNPKTSWQYNPTEYPNASPNFLEKVLDSEKLNKVANKYVREEYNKAIKAYKAG